MLLSSEWLPLALSLIAINISSRIFWSLVIPSLYFHRKEPMGGGASICCHYHYCYTPAKIWSHYYHRLYNTHLLFQGKDVFFSLSLLYCLTSFIITLCIRRRLLLSFLLFLIQQDHTHTLVLNWTCTWLQDEIKEFIASAIRHIKWVW